MRRHTYLVQARGDGVGSDGMEVGSSRVQRAIRIVQSPLWPGLPRDLGADAPTIILRHALA
jgi:hypothetical protein